MEEQSHVYQYLRHFIIINISLRPHLQFLFPMTSEKARFAHEVAQVEQWWKVCDFPLGILKHLYR